ncbi:MAG TPA: hypothetical protein VGL53_20930 [Bryobacteraceae bacterium]|jgi:hypothetical protein
MLANALSRKMRGPHLLLLALSLASTLSNAQPEPTATRQLTACAAKKHGSRTIVSRFGLIELTIPKQLSLHRTHDADYIEYRIIYGRGSSTQSLRIIFGNTVGPLPTEHPEGTIKQHEWLCSPSDQGLDQTFVDHDGLKSRQVQLPFGFAEYHRASTKASAAFDLILDNMCCGASQIKEHR